MSERKRKHDLREIWNAIFFWSKQAASGGCYPVVLPSGS